MKKPINSDRLVFEVHSYTPITSNLVRVSEPARKVLNEIQSETGLSARAIVSQMVIWCSDKIEIKEI